MNGPDEVLALRNKRAWADLYGSTPHLVWGRAPVGFLAPFLAPEVAAGRKFARLLDAAAGEGRNLPLLRQFGGELTACDASGEALAKIPAAAAVGVRRVTCDLAATPFADGEFDFILLSDIVETLPEPLGVLREMRRILAPTGVLVCNIPGPEDGVAGVDMSSLGPNRYLYRDKFYYRFFEAAEAVQLITGGGLQVIREQLLHWEEAAHPEFRGETHTHASRVFMAGRPPV